MNDLPVISNASSLIALAQIDHLDLLKQLFQTIVISSAVVEEISPTVSIPNWIEQHELSQSIDPCNITTGHTHHSLILSFDNLLDTEYRNHLSRIRSVMPETERSIKAHYKLSFF